MSATPKTYQQNLTKGLENNLSQQLIENGKLRFTKDTGRLFVDMVEGAISKRIKISEVINDKTDAQIKALISPIVGKIYLANDTYRAYTFNGMGMVDLGSVTLISAEDENVDKPVWFSQSTDSNPRYSDNITYNESSSELKVPNLSASDAVQVNGMTITDSTETVSGTEVHTVRFSFS